MRLLFSALSPRRVSPQFGARACISPTRSLSIGWITQGRPNTFHCVPAKIWEEASYRFMFWWVSTVLRGRSAEPPDFAQGWPAPRCLLTKLLPVTSPLFSSRPTTSFPGLFSSKEGAGRKRGCTSKTICCGPLSTPDCWMRFWWYFGSVKMKITAVAWISARIGLIYFLITQ